MKIFKRLLTAVLSILMIFSCILNASALQDNQIYLSAPDTVDLNQDFELTISISGKNIYGANSIVSFDSSLVKFNSVESSFPASWKTETNVVDNQVIFASTDETLNSPISKKTAVIKFKFTALALSSNCLFKSFETYFTDGKENISVEDESFSLKIVQEDGGFSEEIIEIFESNYLKSLIVKNAEISPAFDPEIKDYNANVPYETKELQVEAVPLDENATVTISETELKYIGRNITRIQVISTSGKKRTYKIYTTRNKNTNLANADNDNDYLWLWILIGSVLVLGIATTVVIILVKKRKVKKQ